MDLGCWPSSMLTYNFHWPSLKTLLPSAVVWKSLAFEPSDSVQWWLVNQSLGVIVAPAPESTTKSFGHRHPSALLELAQVQRDLHLYLPCKVVIELSMESTC